MPVRCLCKSAATRLPLNLHCSTQATRPLSSGVGPAKLCAMPVTKEEVVALLHAQGIPHMVYDHAAVMTAEAQGQELAEVDGTVTKNLFLKDKKQRQYLITALPDTKVDVKVLSSRLGCGKGGLSWGSEERLKDSLGVAAGCVTPLALANESAGNTLLLLDAKLRSAGRFFVHPIVNDASVALDWAGLEAFLRAVGREPIAVDLEAEPKIDRDNPPDLKQYADRIQPTKRAGEDASGEGGHDCAAVAAAPPPTAVAAAPSRPAAAVANTAAASSSGSDGRKAGRAASKGKQPQAPGAEASALQFAPVMDVQRQAQELIDKVAKALVGKGASESGADRYTLQVLQENVESQLTGLKNAAYTLGFTASRDRLVALATNKYA